MLRLLCMYRVRKQIEADNIGDIDTEESSVTVAVLDTGIAPHPDLHNKALAFKDFVHNREEAYDDNGHGTHVCGIICGSGIVSGGKYRGIAPSAKLVVAKVLDNKGDGKSENMLEALKWILEVRKKYNIRVLNISVGIGELGITDKIQGVNTLIREAWQSGIIVVCAAGNKGPENGSISAVANWNKIITVGCHDGKYYRWNPNRCETYSGRGDSESAIRKPDIVAPGTNIFSCNFMYKNVNGMIKNAYISKSGTSMATPIVSGAVVRILQKYPMLSCEDVKTRLTITATDLGEPWNKQGWGMINFKNLLR